MFMSSKIVCILVERSSFIDVINVGKLLLKYLLAKINETNRVGSIQSLGDKILDFDILVNNIECNKIVMLCSSASLVFGSERFLGDHQEFHGTTD